MAGIGRQLGGFGVPVDQTIEALLTQSAQDQQEVTNQLGWQVRKAVEVLVQSFDKLDQDSNRLLLAGVDEKQLYEAKMRVLEAGRPAYKPSP